MKRFTLQFITTILFLGVVISSLFVSVSAASVTPDINNIFTFPVTGQKVLSEYGVVTPSTLSDTFSVPYRTATAGEGFDYYIRTNGLFTYKVPPEGADRYSLTFIPDFGSSWSSFDKTKMNYIRFEFGVCVYGEYSDIDFLSIFRNGVELSDSYTISYTESSSSIQLSIGGNTYGYYRRLICDIYFDDVSGFSPTDIIEFRIKQPLLPFYDPDTIPTKYVGVSYQIGVNSLSVGGLTPEQYLDRIDTGIGSINNTVIHISEALDKGLTPEQQQKLESNKQIVVVRKEYEDQIEDQYQEVLDKIDENGYDINNTDYEQAYNTASSAFSGSGVSSFSDVLWNNSWVITAFGLVMTFVIIKIAIFGVG